MLSLNTYVRLCRLLDRLGIPLFGSLHYIGGSDPLPAPLLRGVDVQPKGELGPLAIPLLPPAGRLVKPLAQVVLKTGRPGPAPPEGDHHHRLLPLRPGGVRPGGDGPDPLSVEVIGHGLADALQPRAHAGPSSRGTSMAHQWGHTPSPTRWADRTRQVRPRHSTTVSRSRGRPAGPM